MQTATVPVAHLARLRAQVAASLPGYLADLATLVDVDCGSYTKDGVDLVGRWTAEVLRDLGASVQVLPNRDLGDTVVGTLHGVGAARALVIGHLDTVFEPGTARERPFRIAAGRAYGPGVCDMKSGLLAGLYALRALRATAREGLAAGRGWRRRRPADDRAGGPGKADSMAAVRPAHLRRESRRGDRVARQHPRDPALAPEHDVALVLECARANGDIVSARKGNQSVALLGARTGGARRGRAREGEERDPRGRPQDDRAARAERPLAGRDVQRGRDPRRHPSQRRRGRGRARGGPALDLPRNLEAAEAAVREIAARSTVPDVTCEVEERGRHWPMERLPAAAALVDATVAIAAALGFELHDAATGGASDANTTAGAGVPSLDGLGPVGGLDHSPDEYVEVNSIVPRVTLFAALLLAIGDGAAAGQRRNVLPQPSQTV